MQFFAFWYENKLSCVDVLTLVDIVTMILNQTMDQKTILTKIITKKITTTLTVTIMTIITAIVQDQSHTQVRDLYQIRFRDQYLVIQRTLLIQMQNHGVYHKFVVGLIQLVTVNIFQNLKKMK